MAGPSSSESLYVAELLDWGCVAQNAEVLRAGAPSARSQVHLV